MKVKITHLKAPWPEGAVVGDVLDLPSVPVWAVGKCKHVGDDVELTIVTGDGPQIVEVTSDDSAEPEFLEVGDELPPISQDEGEVVGQPIPEIEAKHSKKQK